MLTSVAAATQPKASGRIKRAEVRRLVHERCPVVLFAVGGAADQIVTLGFALDIGAKGVGLLLQDYVKPGTRLILEFRRSTQTQRFEAVMAWCGVLPLSGRVLSHLPMRYRGGLTFRLGGTNDPKALEQLGASL